MIKRTIFTLGKTLSTKITPKYTYSILALRTSYSFTAKYSTGYHPPQSQLTNFIKLMSEIENKQSMQEAANKMAQLQADQELYKQQLLTMSLQKQKLDSQNPQIARMLEHNRMLQNQVNSIIEETKDAETRSVKELDKIKTYGITKIAKEVIEISDHLTQSIALLEKSDIPSDSATLKCLHLIYQQLAELLKKYHIQEFNPRNELFDPNLHESVGYIETDDVTKVNVIAQTKRTGFMLKDRLLRSAFVVIYK